MPEMNGIEASTEIQKLYSDRGIDPPVIIGQSGDLSENLVERCRKAGISKNIMKPFSFMNFKDILVEYDMI